MQFKNIEIDDLTIGDAKSLLKAAKEVAALLGEGPALETGSTSAMIGERCVVRTYSAGVHIGTVEKVDGTSVLLSDSVRLCKWTGAFTLSEVATKGVGADSRIASRVDLIELTQAIEIIPTTAAARETMEPRNG